MPPTAAAIAARPQECGKCGATQPGIQYEQDVFGEYWVCVCCGWTVNVEATRRGPMKHRRRPAESQGVRL